MTWLTEIVAAFEALGGTANYEELYSYIRTHTSRKLPTSWRAIIRSVVERRSSDSQAFNGKKDLFYSVNGLGKGVWGLR